MPQTAINFGYFIRQAREAKGLSRNQLIANAGIDLSERRLWQIETGMARPRMQRAKFDAIARALGYSRSALERAWQSTPAAVPPTRHRRAGDGLMANWISAEAARLGIAPSEAQNRAVGLLNHFSADERDRLYAGAGEKSAVTENVQELPEPHGRRLPRPGKDSRLRAAAKTIGKAGRPKP